jgi:hypothetical protein
MWCLVSGVFSPEVFEDFPLKMSRPSGRQNQQAIQAVDRIFTDFLRLPGHFMTGRELEYQRACDTFLQRIRIASDLESIQAVARDFNAVLSLFISNRRYGANFLFDQKYEAFFEACEKLVRNQDHSYLAVLQAAGSIAGGLSFIKWKTLSDLHADQLFIFDSFVLPLIRIEKKITPSIQSSTNAIFMYLPNVSPQAIGVANGKSAAEMLDQYCEAARANLAAVNLFVGVQGGKAGQIEAWSFRDESYDASLRCFRYASFSELLSFVKVIRPHTIIIDYFSYPWNILPRLFPEIQFVYRSMGLNCFVARNCRLIIGNDNDSSFSAILGAMRSRLSSLDVFVESITIPRTRAPRAAAAPALSRVAETRRALSALGSCRNRHIFGTLCRGTKISQRYASLIEEILSREPGACFFGMGSGVPASSAFFSEKFKDRVFLFDDVEPSSVLDKVDVYLETFPEHQGMSVIEALSAGVAVVSLNAVNARHVLLNERLSECVAQTESDYVALALGLLDPEMREDVARRQVKIVDLAYGEPVAIWKMIESVVLVGANNAGFAPGRG